ncbi:MAG: DUF4242 domain-containing protein [Actinobacteria bacterium]|nr:MAG: DUF4242 domain-containing protein [Actinomycetota bacterium]
MPLYVIERALADELDVSGDDVRLIDEINADEGVRWIFSFLSADRRQTYCLYEAPSPDAIIAAAKRANLPADAIVEVGAAAPELSERLRDWAASQPARSQTG